MYKSNENLRTIKQIWKLKFQQMVLMVHQTKIKDETGKLEVISVKNIHNETEKNNKYVNKKKGHTEW